MANGIDKTTLAPDRTHVKSAFVSALCTHLGVNDSPDTRPLDPFQTPCSSCNAFAMNVFKLVCTSCKLD